MHYSAHSHDAHDIECIGFGLSYYDYSSFNCFNKRNGDEKSDCC